LENPIWIRLVALERGHKGLLQVTISELDDSKLYTSEAISSSFKVKKTCVDFLFIFLKLVLKNYFEEFKRHSRALLLVTDVLRKENANT